MRPILMGLLMVALLGCARPAPAGDPSRAAEFAASRKLYVAKCAKCHRLYDPSKYSEADWKIWLSKMSRKAKLTQAQQGDLSRYLETTFRKPAKVENPPKER